MLQPLTDYSTGANTLSNSIFKGSGGWYVCFYNNANIDINLTLQVNCLCGR